MDSASAPSQTPSFTALRRGAAAALGLVVIALGTASTLYGTIGLGLCVSAFGIGVAVFAFRHFVADEIDRIERALDDARYRIDDATGRAKEAESELAETRRREREASRLALVARRTTSAVVITDCRGRTEWVNDGFTRMSGYTLEEMLGRTPGQLLRNPRTPDEEIDEMRRAVWEGRRYAGEVWNRSKDGRDFLVALEIEPLHGDDGELVGFMGLESDVTNERELARRIQESETRMRRLVEETRVVAWEFDPESDRYTYVSPQVERFGHAEAEWRVAGRHRDLVHEDDFAEMARARERAIERGEDLEHCYRIVAADGSVVWVRDLAKVDRGEDGTVRLRGVLVDITEQRRAEEDLAKVSERARLQAERFELAMGGGEIGLWDWHPQEDELVVNGRWAAMIGLTLDDLTRTTADWQKRLHPDDRGPTRRALEAHFSGETDVYESLFRLQHDDGSWVWILGRGKVVERDPKGCPVRVVGVQIDRTADVERSLELESLRERAELASRSKSEFLANVSHEIRTPLTAILGYADILREDGNIERAPRRRIEMLDTIQSAGRHLLTLINDILDLSKIEANRMTVEEIEFHLPELLLEVAELVRPRVDEKGLRLDVEVATPIPAMIQSDPTRLRQILVNVLGNASKFTNEGRIVMRAFVRDDALVVIEVEDTGAGMTQRQVDQLFRPFVQADGTVTRRFGGTGLGLTISRRLAHLMDGEVRLVRSTPGDGSLFAVEIPLRTSDDVVYVTSLGNDEPEEEAPVDCGPRIVGRVLLVDDGPVNRKIFSTMLERAGADVAQANDGVEALAMIDTACQDDRPFDLIVSDMKMPGMDGYTFARTLRERGDRTPIVALTAHAMAEDRDRCIEAGCDDVVVKPV
ncbi:MAG: PAS domain-containing protein, partial [Planctomycetota bacterium]